MREKKTLVLSLTFKLVFIFIFLSQQVIAQDSINGITGRLSNLESSSRIINENLATLKYIISKDKESKDLSGLFTIIVAFSAVLVSILSAFLNYKVFKGQSISSYRKNWNNGLIDNTSEFIIISSNLFSSVKKGILPTNYESEIVSLNKLTHSIYFKFKEIGYTNDSINSSLTSILNSILISKKDPTVTSLEDFNKLVSDLSVGISQVLADNWKSIQKFK